MDMTDDEEEAKVHYPVSQRGDSGVYTVKVSNPHGEDSGDIKVTVLGMYCRINRNWICIAVEPILWGHPFCIRKVAFQEGWPLVRGRNQYIYV